MTGPSRGFWEHLRLRRGGFAPWALQPWQSILLLALVVVVAVLGFTVSDLSRRFNRELDATGLRTQNIARLLEEHTRQSLRRIDLLMAHARQDLAKLGEAALRRPDAVRARLQSLLPDDGVIADLSVFDASGRLVASAGTRLPVDPPNIGSHEFFAVHRESSNRGLHFGATGISSVTGVLSVPISVRLGPAGGAFDGVLLGTLNAAYFQSFYDAINKGSNGFVTLFGRDGSVLARSPFDAKMALRNWSDTPMFRQHLPLAPIKTVRQVVVADRVERVYSYRALADYPVVVTVGLALEDVMAAWRVQAWRDGALVLAFLLVLGLSTAALVRQLRVRSRQERQLGESERRWRFAIEGAGDGLWDWDIAAGTVFHSSRCNSMLGQNEGDIGSSPDDWSQRIHPDDRVRVMTERQAHLRGTREHYDCEYRVCCKDGSWKWLLDRGMVVARDAAGEPVRMIGTYCDIGARKRLEASIQDSQERTRALSEVTFEALFISAKGICLEQNQQAQVMFGYSDGEAVGRPGIEWIAEPDRQRVAEHMRNGYELPYGVTALRKDGSAFAAIIQARVMSFRGGPVRLTSVLDITERNTMESALRQRDHYQRSLLDNFPFLVWLKDGQSRLLAVNQPYALACGHTCARELEGKTDLDLWPTDLAWRYQADDRAVMMSGQPKTVEELIDVNGTRTWFETYKSPLLVDGKPVGTVGFARDITEHRQQEQLRQDQVQRIELLSRHLVRAQEETRGRFARELHDRTSPNLAALRINLDVIASATSELRLGRGFEERVEDTRALIEDTTHSIREICADLHPTTLEGAGLLGAVRSYAFQFERRTGVPVLVQCQHAEQRLALDLELALFRIVQEAMTNCAKHAEATRIVVKLELNGNPLRVSIADDGVGMPTEHLQARASGDGLGLQTMRETAEFFGGRFDVRSAPGHGTQVSVEIDRPQPGTDP